MSKPIYVRAGITIVLFALATFVFSDYRSQVVASSFSISSTPTGKSASNQPDPFCGNNLAEQIFGRYSAKELLSLSLLLGASGSSKALFTGCSSPSFAAAPTSPEPAGDNPHYVAIGYINADSHLDIISTDYDSDSITILIGDGTGNFTIFGSPIPVGDQPVTAEIGDYNNDGKQDVAVCNQLSDNVSILLGNGDGTFTAAGLPIVVGDAPRTVVKGFFNADSNLDLVTTNGGSNNLTILLGNGNGTFSTSTLAGGFAPFHAVVGNFNGDSNSDLAVANLGGGTVSIFLGNGSGGFTQAGSEIAVGSFSSYIAMGLYNGDSNLDLAVCNRLSNNVAVLLGNGSGGFSQAAGSPYAVGSAPMGVATGDLNLDGILDLAISNENSANTTILLGNGNGGFGSPTPVNKGLLPTHVALADFNEDSKLDIATSDGGSDTITILLNTCTACPSINVSPATISSGTVGSGFSETFSASGGISPYTFSLTGALPNGMTFSDPTLSGTPTESGSFPITITAMDSNGCTGSANYTLIVNCQVITIDQTTILSGTAGSAYSQTFTQTGGNGTTTFSLTGTLPNGITLSGATLSGTPTQTGNYPITITATDANGCTGSRAYTLSINCQNIIVNPATIPSGTAGTAYSQTFTQTGGIGTTTFSLTGTLPTGLTFSGATLSGTPTQTGSFPVTVTATDANGCTGNRNYTLVIACQSITINPLTISTGTVNSAYSQTFTQTGGIGTTTFALTGTLPTGLTFSGATLSGTPTQSGSFPITVTATDANGCTGSRGYTLVINCQSITVNPATIAEGTVSTVYSQSFTQSGGIGTTTFALTGTLPTGLNFSGATLSGTPTQRGSFPITVTATDSNGCTGTRNYTLVINCQTITVNPATISSGTAGTAYSQNFTQTGGIGTTTFSITGTLPTGLSLSGATLSGTPTQTGSFPINVIATDSNGCTGSRSYTLVINCQTFSVTPTSIPAGTAGTTYNQTFSHTGGIDAVTFGQSGKLPTGMTFSGATLSGIPTQTGSFPISITATDVNGCTATRNYTVVVNCQNITVNPTTIPSGAVGTTYSQSFTQTGGIGTTGFSLTGALPTGLTFSGATLSGTPMQSGSFSITVTATDSNGCTGSRNYTLVINCQALTVNPAAIPAGTVNTVYSQTFTQTGGIGTTGFSLTGTLPTGLTFSGATLSGTPTQSGSFPITVTATDSNNCTGSRGYTLVINCQTISILPATIPAGTAGSAYSQTFTTNNSIGTVTFLQNGKLPAGISFTGATLSGTPTQTGSFPISITATDANNCSTTRNYTLTINCQSITVNPSTIPGGTAGTAYAQTFTQTGGIGTTTFALTGTLPTGLSFTGATLSGTPTQAGNFPITVTATDANGCTGSRNYTLTICASITIIPATIPSGLTGSPYLQTFTQTGGVGSTTFSLTGTLPTGMSFTSPILSGTPTQAGSFPITVTATDSNGCIGSRNYTLVVCATITVNPATIPAGTAGTAYSQSFTQTGGVGTTTFGLTGTLPTGITFTGGALSGTPTQSGSFPITVSATDSNGCTGNRNYTLVINCQTITVNPTTIPAGSVSTAYSQTFTQTGGIGTTGFSLTGTLPTGLTFSGATLSGTPTQSGSFPVTVTATDSNGCTGSRNYTLVINCQTISILPATIPAGIAGSVFSQSFTANGGVGTVTFSQNGKLPAGLTFTGATLSGTPTQVGSFPISITATDANNCSSTRNYTLVINCQTITVNPVTIPGGMVGTAYSQTFTQTGGIGTTTYALTGTLPTGLTFTGATLSGTPTQAGNFPITVTATDANGCTGSRNYTLALCASIIVNPATIPGGLTGSSYTQTFTQSGGVGSTTFSLTGTLPTGMSFTSPILSGTPTQAGSFPITVTATDSNGCIGSRNYTLVVCATITVNPATIPGGTAGTAYSQTFTQTGGVGTTTFSRTGTLPTGMTFTGATLSGTPTQTGSFPITISATDSNGCTGSRNYTLVINCQGITVNPATIPSGSVGVVYSQSFTQTGGIGTTGFSVTGILPTGLSVSGATLSGTPTQSGSFPITVVATDSNGCTGSRNYTLIINCQSLTVNPAAIPAGTVNTVYSQTFTQTGGVGTVSFSLTGALPTGLTFSGATLSGTPTQSGSFPITVTATDSNNCTGSRSYTLVINCQTISILPSTIPAGTAGSAYSQTFTTNNSIGTVTFLQNGKLPAGISFTGATLSGTPTQTGSFPISITATDANNCSTTRNYTLTINCQGITVNPATISTATAGTLYSQAFTQTGGIGTTTFSLTGTLPAGLTFSGGTLSGTPTQTGSFPIAVTATDANGCSGSRNYTLTVNCQSITVNPATIPAGTANTAYSQGFTQSGGIGAVNFSLTGALPSGLTFAGATLSGTPTQTGSFPITVTATDANGCTGSRNYTLLINCQGFTINPASLPAATLGVPYNQTLTQTGGVGGVTYNLTGTLPNGITFAGATFSGTPTQPGSFPITVTAIDSNSCTASRNYTLVVNCQTITVNPATIPAGIAGTAYSQSFTQVGGIGATNFSLTGKLPTGITFAGGALSGTPTQPGSFPITVTATDSNGCTGSSSYTLVINCQTITVNPATIPAGIAGTAYGQSFTQVGGIGATTFNLTGKLPTGMTFAGNTLSGTPTQTGSFPITVTATDSNGCAGSRNYTLVINCPVVTVNPATLPNGFAGVNYGTQTLSATGGIGSYTFSLSAGSLPNGISLSGANLSGTPTIGGTFNFTIQAADSNGCVGTRAYTVIISGGPKGTGLQFYPLPAPVRLLDTRTGATGCFTPQAQIQGNTSLTQLAAGACSIPSTALAVTGNITTVQSGGGFLTIYPSDATRPTVANSNFAANEILNNVFTVGLGATDGAFKIYVTTNTHVVVDITGYYAPPGAGGLYYHKLPSPIRLLETRKGQPGCFTPGTALPANTDTLQQGTTTCGGVTIPSSAVALYGNATTVGPASNGFLTFFPANASRPLIASGNYQSGQTLNSPFVVGLSPAGQFKIYTVAQTNLVVDVHGYFSTEANDVNGQGLLFTPLAAPVRLLDTRTTGQSGCFTPGAALQAMVEQFQLARGTCTIGASAQAIVGNATVVNNPSNGFLTLWPSDATRPLVASSNWVANKVFNRFFMVSLGADGKFGMYASSGTDLVVDVSGYFAP